MGKYGTTPPPENPVYLGTLDVRKARTQLCSVIAVLCCAFTFDLVSVVALYLSLHLWTLAPHHKSWRGFWKSLFAFSTDSGDLVCLCVARMVLFTSFAYYAGGLAWKEQKKSEVGGGGRKTAGGVQAEGSVNHNVRGGAPAGASTSDLYEPLLGSRSRERKAQKSPKAAKDKGFSEWFSGTSRKDVILMVSFLCSTIFQVYVGAKCVSFNFGDELVQGFLMGSGVFWINCESMLVGRVVKSCYVVQRAQQHEAQRQLEEERANDPEAAANRITGDFGKSILDPLSAAVVVREGTLRGDKGIRSEMDVSHQKYLIRALSLARQEAGLITLGIFCLLVTAGSSLILPNYQGSILDRVIQSDVPGFRADVVLLIAFSFVNGVFGGIRGLCFSMVAKRVLKTLQDRLFRGVITQDIAYFDATTSGELTSRLTNDVGSMSEPLNWMLSTLLRNLLNLAGGFVMCFYTSWKLSMLAFTTMAPIMHITAIYSRWSRELNRKRYALLAEANSAAAEALGNIRTVRAFSTEDVEVERFKSKTLAAMVKGVRDAYAYSGAVAINNWLDLGASITSMNGSIKLENVFFHYQMRPQHSVLAGVNLTVDEGKVCALVGRSGGGKSTIIHLLMRFYDPVSGRILLDGRDLKDLNLRSVHRHMGTVAQDTQMFACSIEENITYGLPTYSKEEMEEASRQANAHDFIMRFPEGYATRVGERGVRLSGGQRQRLAIARMLLRKPKILLLDEATSALDTESEALVQQALDRLIEAGGRTVILVAHRLSTVRNAHQIAVMEKGRVVELGTHDQLITKNEGVYARLVRRQVYSEANKIAEDFAAYSGGMSVHMDSSNGLSIQMASQP
ncbi:hypothetical protein CBR_g30946 [Chara braunii]|uniref:Uncharacterized protein n=1 Tax=Chara braunii TaxID=69332 RepID=A0A388LDV3_CHABU|nr:hypothetical protein CBR_g30946 [Chara braunii]|eukprot:GBG80484.1 hypothetical protein CBR_g30946 [Chara braunii]